MGKRQATKRINVNNAQKMSSFLKPEVLVQAAAIDASAAVRFVPNGPDTVSSLEVLPVSIFFSS